MNVLYIISKLINNELLVCHTFSVGTVFSFLKNIPI